MGKHHHHIFVRTLPKKTLKHLRHEPEVVFVQIFFKINTALLGNYVTKSPIFIP
jgi:hypothetical protein